MSTIRNNKGEVMCHKRNICPNYDCRQIGTSNCDNCDYIKSVYKTRFYCRVALLVALVLFVCTTAMIA